MRAAPVTVTVLAYPASIRPQPRFASSFPITIGARAFDRNSTNEPNGQQVAGFA